MGLGFDKPGRIFCVGRYKGIGCRILKITFRVGVFPAQEGKTLRSFCSGQATQRGAGTVLTAVRFAVAIIKGGDDRGAGPHRIYLYGVIAVFHILRRDGNIGSEVHHLTGGRNFQLPLEKGFAVVFAMGTQFAVVVGIYIRGTGNIGFGNTLPQSKCGRGISAQYIGDAVPLFAAYKVQTVVLFSLVKIKGENGVRFNWGLNIESRALKIHPRIGRLVSIGIVVADIRYNDFWQRQAIALQAAAGGQGIAA